MKRTWADKFTGFFRMLGGVLLVVISLLGILGTIGLELMAMVGEAVDTTSSTHPGRYLGYKFLALLPLVAILIIWSALFLRWHWRQNRQLDR